MSSDTTQPTDETEDQDNDQNRELTGEQLLDRERSLRQQRKTFVIEYPDGATASFEYKMLSEAEMDQIEEAVTDVTPSRTGDPEIEIDRQHFRTKLIMAATTDAPEGFKITTRTVEQLSRDTRESFADAVEDFASMDEVTRQKFR